MGIGALSTFLLLIVSKGVTANGCENHFELSVESKGNYERALSLCISDSDTYLTTSVGVLDAQIHISKCQFQHFFDILWPIEGDISLNPESLAIFKVLDQSPGPHLSLCDLIFGAEKLKKDFKLLQSVFGESGASTDETTSIVSLAKMVDNRCELDCRACPKSLCVTKAACAYNIHLGCFSTGQPTLKPTDPVPHFNAKDPEESSSASVLQPHSHLFIPSTTSKESVQIENQPESSSIWTELFLCLSTGMWIALVIYLIRLRRCKCGLCSHRAPIKMSKNMDGIRMGEFSEGEVCESSPIIQAEGFGCNGGTSGRLNRIVSPTTRREIYVGAVPTYAYLEKTHEAPGEAKPSCFVKSKTSNLHNGHSGRQARVLSSSYCRDRVISENSSKHKIFAQISPPIAVEGVYSDRNSKLAAQDSPPIQRAQIQEVSQRRDIESDVSVMSFMIGVKASSDEDSGYDS